MFWIVAPESRAPIRRLFVLQANQYGAWDFDSLVVATGKRPADEMRYLKSVALHHWLFGLEISGTPFGRFTARLRRALVLQDTASHPALTLRPGLQISSCSSRRTS